METRRDGDDPPAILLGGIGSTVSIARSLGRQGVDVLVLATAPGSLAESSRFCTEVVTPPAAADGVVGGWLAWLEAREADGAVLLPTGDEGVELVVRHAARLAAAGYRMLDYAGDTSLAMLDKHRTYELAREAGVPCPRTRTVRAAEDLEGIEDEISFPCGLKPVHSHLFAKHFDVKVLVANGPSELRAHLGRTVELGLEMLVTEIIPGPESRTWTYSTYLDERGEPLFDLTRIKLRSFPVRFGNASFTRTRWHPEVAEAGLRFLRGVGLVGMAHVEFKLDPRDGELKLIECNHRFVNVQELLRRSGLDVAPVAYARALGRPEPPMGRWREDVRLWFPAQDLLAATEYRRDGELTWAGWVRSLARPPVYLPYLALDDPGPSVRAVSQRLWGRRLLGRFKRSRARAG
jgi:D-aspartate ligase